MKKGLVSINSFPTWLRTKLSKVPYLIWVATWTGLFSGLLAVLLKTLVHELSGNIQGSPIPAWAKFFVPTIGLLLTVFLVRQFFGGFIERGIVMVLRAISRKSGFIPFKHTYLHVLTSAITVGTGGSAGLEAPIVATGAAVGSNLSRWHDMSMQERNLLLACGSAAGIAAVFNAPVAGVMFAMEVLLAEVSVTFFIPVVIAAVTGALCSHIILAESVLFRFDLQQHFDYSNMPYYIVLGVVAGLVARYYAWAFQRTEASIRKLPVHPYGKALVGGAVLAGLLMLLPPLLGEGYPSILMLAHDNLDAYARQSAWLGELDPTISMLLITGAIIALKPIAVAITLGSGGNGGNFAPSLFSGAYLGYFFARLINVLDWVKLPVANFSLVAMAGILSGVMYAPLTGVFLIAEITNGYELMIPLLIVSILSYGVVKFYHPYSMDVRRLAAEGNLPVADREKQILAHIQLDEVLQNQYATIAADQKLRALIQLIQTSEKNIFAVHDSKNRLVGIIELNDIKAHIFNMEGYDRRSVKSLMKRPAVVLLNTQTMEDAMASFDRTGSWYLPVVNDQKQFQGFISKTRLFARYRELLNRQADLYDEKPPRDPSETLE